MSESSKKSNNSLFNAGPLTSQQSISQVGTASAIATHKARHQVLQAKNGKNCWEDMLWKNGMYILMYSISYT